METKMKYIRLFVALLLLSAGLAHLTAGPPYQYWRTYYTDATRTVECGYANVACNGTTYSGCFTSEYYADEFMAYCGSNGSDCELAKVGTECADYFDNDEDSYTDQGDQACWPCYATHESD
jgi:hypothetical protein